MYVEGYCFQSMYILPFTLETTFTHSLSDEPICVFTIILGDTNVLFVITVL